MTTFLAQNQFISNPSVIEPPTERSAAASKPPPAADAAAAPIADPDRGYMGQRLTPALGTSVSSAVTEPVRTVTADPIDHIHEIFFYVRKLLVEDNRRAEDFVDWQVLEAAVLEEEPLPLFIRDGEHLRRWA